MATATIGASSVDRLARSKRPIVERTEIHIPPAPQLSPEAVTGPTLNRLAAVSRFNADLQKWRNDAWAVEMPGQPDFALQTDVATLRDETKEMIAQIQTNTLAITNIETDITTINNQITTINNNITTIEDNTATGTGIVQAKTGDPQDTVLGTDGHVPFWRGLKPFLSPTSPIYTDGTLVGIGTDLPAVLLDIGLAGVTGAVVRLAGASGGNVTIQPVAIAGTWTWTLPVNDGTANEFLKTDGTGITSWSSVVLTTDVTGILPLANGGTNAALVAVNGGTVYSTATAFGITAVGVVGQVLTSQAAAPPIWTTPATVTPSALTDVDDTNVTITLGGSPTVALLAATSITLGWTGQLSIARGGTNASSFATADGVVYFDGTRLINIADFLYTGSKVMSRGVSLNGVNEPYVTRNINTGANAGTGYEAELSDTSNNLLFAGWITWTKEQSWTTTASTQDASAEIATILNGVTAAALSLRSSGSIICGKDSTGTTRTDDFTYICTTNGVPTGVPTTFGSRVPLCFDPNTDTFYIYRGGWKGVVVT